MLFRYSDCLFSQIFFVNCLTKAITQKADHIAFLMFVQPLFIIWLILHHWSTHYLFSMCFSVNITDFAKKIYLLENNLIITHVFTWRDFLLQQIYKINTDKTKTIDLILEWLDANWAAASSAILFCHCSVPKQNWHSENLS